MEIENTSNSQAPRLVSQTTIEADLESDKFVYKFPKQVGLFENIEPVLHSKEEVMRLCKQPYYNHEDGCPNWGKKKGCPPNLPLLDEQYDLRTIHPIVVRFPFKQYFDTKKRELHPNWTNRALINQRHWQSHLRSFALGYWDYIKYDLTEYKLIKNPEGQGVNLQYSLEQIGINLEWCVQDEEWKIIEIPNYMHYACLIGKEL